MSLLIFVNDFKFDCQIHYYPSHSAQIANETQRHKWSVTLAGCLMDTMDQRERKNKDEKRTCGKKQSTSKKQKSYKLIALGTINLSLVLTFI